MNIEKLKEMERITCAIENQIARSVKKSLVADMAVIKGKVELLSTELNNELRIAHRKAREEEDERANSIFEKIKTWLGLPTELQEESIEPVEVKNFKLEIFMYTGQHLAFNRVCTVDTANAIMAYKNFYDWFTDKDSEPSYEHRYDNGSTVFYKKDITRINMYEVK